MVEICAEPAFPHRGGEIGIGGADDPDIHDLGRSGAETTNGAIVQERQNLRLERCRKQRDLIEEQGAAVGELEEAGFRATSVRESSAFIAEQLRFEQVFGNRGAVDIDERTARAGASPMNRAGDETLAGPCLAADQEWRWASRANPQDLLDARAQTHDVGTIADDLAQGVHARIIARAV